MIFHNLTAVSWTLWWEPHWHLKKIYIYFFLVCIRHFNERWKEIWLILSCICSPQNTALPLDEDVSYSDLLTQHSLATPETTDHSDVTGADHRSERTGHELDTAMTASYSRSYRSSFEKPIDSAEKYRQALSELRASWNLWTW